MNDVEYLKLKTQELGLRIDVLEAKSRGETLDNNKELAEVQAKLSPRTQSEQITQGNDAPHQIGEKTLEMLEQDVKSLIQNFKPQTMTPEEKQKMRTSVTEIITEIETRPGNFTYSYLKHLKEMLASLQ